MLYSPLLWLFQGCTIRRDAPREGTATFSMSFLILLVLLLELTETCLPSPHLMSSSHHCPHAIPRQITTGVPVTRPSPPNPSSLTPSPPSSLLPPPSGGARQHIIRAGAGMEGGLIDPHAVAPHPIAAAGGDSEGLTQGQSPGSGHIAGGGRGQSPGREHTADGQGQSPVKGSPIGDITTVTIEDTRGLHPDHLETVVGHQAQAAVQGQHQVTGSGRGGTERRRRGRKSESQRNIARGVGRGCAL